MKKILSITLAIIMIASMFALSGVTSTAANPGGSCGDGVTWEYSQETKTLTISGSGYMTDYFYNDGSYNRPWEAFVDEIEDVDLKGGLLSVGDYAFAGCKNLKDYAYYIDTDISIIGQGAFQSCASLTEMKFPLSLVAIGPSAFEGCTKLDIVKLHKNVKYIGDDAFAGCPMNYIIYAGIPEQMDLIFFEDNTESLKNVIFADTEFDIAVRENEYQILTAVSLEPFTFTIKDAGIAEILGTEYGTVTEEGTLYYYGAVAVSSVSNGMTAIYAIGNNKEIIGAFSVISGYCAFFSHECGEKQELKAPTCYQEGLVIEECKICSHKETTFTIGQHSFVYETLVEGDCETNKEEKGTCTVCGAITFREVASSGHRFTKVTITEPTCQAPGLHVGEFEPWGKVYQYEIPITDHNWTDWVVTLAPTEEADGEREHKCTTCEKVEKEIIPALSTVIGDVNGDGRVSAIDARWALQCAAGNRELEQYYFKMADINNDGKVTAFDARKILQIAANQ